MKINKEERTTLVMAMLAFTIMVIVAWLSITTGLLDMNQESLRSMHLLLGVMCAAVSFAIFTQGWILFDNYLSRQRLYSAVLFSVIGMLDILHIAAYSGISLFGFQPEFRLSAWFLLVSHIVGAVGMLAIFSFPDKQVSSKHKITFFAGASFVTGIVIFFMYKFQGDLLPLETTIGIGFRGSVSLVAGLLMYMTAIVVILYRHRYARPPAVMIVIRSLILMMMGHILLTLSFSERGSLLHVIGEVYMAFSYYYVLKGIYTLTLEEPIQEQQKVKAQMQYMAYHDELTGLPNIRQLKERLAYFLSTGKRCIGVAVVNMNRFKAINDSLGYSAGDKVLMEVGERLLEQVAQAEEVYRLGEDEFAIIIPDTVQAADAEMRAQNLLTSVTPSVILDDTEYHISLSMGLSVFPDDGFSVEHLIQYADMAVHHAKENGVEFARYKAAMKLRTQSKVELENDMRKALERGEFFLEFQPQMSLDTGKMVGTEALVRWNHPKRGIISPNEFIPLAEESGLIVPLGEWVLRTACTYNKKWQVEGYEPVCMSVNLSMRQFRQHNLAENVDAILQEVGLEARYLELEVTESMTFDMDTAYEQLHSLKRLGVHISIDDFGTGYSSLNYLKMLPIDRLKIDRSFVKEVMQDDNDAAIVSTITTMAHHLKLKVTAEGVENVEQLEYLKLQNCHEGQGYLFSKPVPAGLFESEFLTPVAI